MKRLIRNKYFTTTSIAVIIIGLLWLGYILINRKSDVTGLTPESISLQKNVKPQATSDDSAPMPVYGNWRNFTSKDGLPSDKAYCVRIDGEKVYVGTHDGLAVYEKGKWKTYTTADGLAHNGVVSIDVSVLTGDVWIGTLGGLSRWSGGKFETFNQFNSGMPNDLVYCVICDGKDVGWLPEVEQVIMILLQRNGRFLQKRMLPCMNHGPMEFQLVTAKFL